MYTIAFDITETSIHHFSEELEELGVFFEIKHDDHQDCYFVEVKTVLIEDLEAIFSLESFSELYPTVNYSAYLELFVEGLE